MASVRFINDDILAISIAIINSSVDLKMGSRLSFPPTD